MRKIFSGNMHPALTWHGMLVWLITLGMLQAISSPAFASVARPAVRPILFIQEGIEDRQLLIDGAGPGVEVVLLDGRRNGLRQIAELLRERRDVPALHVISHGAPGQLALGSGEVDIVSLERQKEELAIIRRALGGDADILLYGCQVAAGTQGRAFMAALANATGAHVAASIDDTGAAALGGNWTLESSTGGIHSASLAFSAYPRLLPSMAGTVSYLVAGARTVDPLFRNYGANNKSNSGAPGGRYSMYFGNANGAIRNSGDTMLGYGTPLTLRSVDSVLNVLVQQAFIIKNDDGLPFRMNSFLVLDNTHTNNPTMTATAYYNGVVKGTQTFTVPQGGTYSGTIVLNSLFNDITELRIDGGAGAQLRQWFNDFNFADPILSTDSFMDALVPSQGTLNQAFASDWYDYTISVPNLPGTISFTPAVADVGRSTVKINGVLVTSGTASSPIALAVGANIITTEVTSHAGGAPRVYTTTVTRAVSANADLGALSTSAGTLGPGFAATTLAYTASVPYTSGTLTVTPTLADGMAAVKVNGVAVANASASAPIALAVGINHLSVLVTAPDGTTQKTYTIDVTRSGNADLSGLTASTGLDQLFATATLGYTASVPNATTSMTVTPATSYATSTVKVNGAPVTSGAASSALPLAVGGNVISVVVTAQDGTTATYTVTVTRQASGNASLGALATSAGTLAPVFGPATLAYSMTLPNAQATLAVTPTVADSTATVKVNGAAVASGTASTALPLAVGGNLINVAVTAQDGSTATYALTVTRQASANASLSALGTSAGTLSPVFGPATLAYGMTLPNAQASLAVTPTVADSTATVKVNGATVASGAASTALPLVVGGNVITIIVTAQDGSTATYTLTVTRQASGNAGLSGLGASTGTLSPVFGSATFAYAMTLPNGQATVAITPTVADSAATVKVNGATVASGAASAALPLTVGANVINVVVTAQDGSTATYVLTVTRQASANASLSALGTSTGTLSPVFGSATLAYSVSLPNATASLTLTPVAADSAATIKVNGAAVASGAATAALPLAVGGNVVNVVVTAQDGSSATYVLTVTRQPSANASLGGLNTSAGTLSPVFGSATMTYSMTLPNAQATLAVTPTVADSTATVKVNGAVVASGAPSSALPLVVGGNVITIIVTAQNSSTSTYTLNVTRQPSANASLSALAASTGSLSPAFGSATLAYGITLPNAQATLVVTPTTADSAATVKVNGNTVASGAASTALPLAVGANVVNVVVTAQDGTTATYVLTVTRQASSNANLSALNVSAGTLGPVFGSATLAYSISLPNGAASLALTPVLADSTAAIKINGATAASGSAAAPVALNVGSNVVNVVVTAQDGTALTYVLTVTRQGSSNADLASLLPSAGSLAPAFAAATSSYTVTLSEPNSSVAMTAVVAEVNATLSIQPGAAAATALASGAASAAMPLAHGANTIVVTVTAQDGTSKPYTIVVNRAAPSSNANLATLTLSSGNLDSAFVTTNHSYSATVSNTVTAMVLTPTLADTTATVKVNGSASASGVAAAPVVLVVGPNAIAIDVLAQDGMTVQHYILTVTRAAPAPPAPIVNTAPAAALSATGATLNGSVNANGGDASVSFLYGATVAYGTSVAVAMAPAAAGNLARLTVLSNLRCNTMYHYTLEAINVSGTTRGNDEHFTTAACPAAATGVPGAPGTPVAAADSEQASVTFAAAETNGGAITGYLVVSSPAGGVDSQAGDTALTHLLTGLKNGVAYTFTVVASNAVGAGPASPPSNSVTPAGAALSGMVYRDDNDNGVREAGEAGLAGVRIVLSGRTADGADVCALRACTAVTGADGGYRFAGLPPGLYALARNPADTDGARYADGRETAGAAGGVVNNDNFGTLPYQTRIAAIGVTAALQARTNGQLDGYLFGLRARAASDLKLPVLSGSVTLRRKSALDDGALAGWSITLTQNEKPVCTVLSNAQGRYRFDNLACPEYRQSGLPTGPGFSISFSKAGSNVRAMTMSGGAAGTAERGVIRDLVLSGWDDIGQQDLPLDPEGIIYDAVSRLPLAGAVIVLSGPPGFDAGRHLVGGAAVQTQTTGGDGMYQYLLQNGYPSGVYTLKVTRAPGGYKPVSALLPPCAGVLTIGPVPDPAYLQSNDGSPPASTPVHDARACPGLVEGGAASTQYYLQLLITNGVSAPILNNHIPLDAPAPGGLALSKNGDRQRAELGDSVRYSLALKRSLGGAPRRIAVRDELPPGFRFIPGTVTVNGVKAADPSSSGSVLGFHLGALGGDQQLVLAYRVRVGVGGMQGDGVNRARAYACADGDCLDPVTLAPVPGAVASNQASFKVQVDAGVFSNEACVVGKVFADCDGDGIQGANEHGIPAVRLYLEDGTHITTDEDGKYSYCGLTPHTHVIKLDPSTLPEGSVAGITGNRNLGDPGSVLLDLRNGELRRADFTEVSCSAPVLARSGGRRAREGAAVAAPQSGSGVSFSSKPAAAGGRATAGVKEKSNEQ